MKKHHMQPSDQIHIPELLEESRYIGWISKYGKQALIGIAVLFAVLVLVYRSGFGGAVQAEGDYLRADTALQGFLKGEKNSLQKLESILKRRPDLAAKYDGIIAQTLLNRGEVEQAIPFAEKTLKRTEHEGLSLYHDYAKTTLQMSEGQYEAALERALNLKDKMLQQAGLKPEKRGFGDILFAFNLLRIAILQQALNSKEEELKTWQEWKQFARWTAEPPPSEHIGARAFHVVLNHLDNDNISLTDYIATREEKLR